MRLEKLTRDPRFMLASTPARLLALLLLPHAGADGVVRAVRSTTLEQTLGVLAGMPVEEVSVALEAGSCTGLFAVEPCSVTVAPQVIPTASTKSVGAKAPLSDAERARRYRAASRHGDRHEARDGVRDERHGERDADGPNRHGPSRTVTETVTKNVTPAVTKVSPTGAPGIARAEDFSKKEEKKEENPQTPFAVTTDRHGDRHDEASRRSVTTKPNVTQPQEPPKGSPPTVKAPSVAVSSSEPQPTPDWDSVQRDVDAEEPQREAEELFPPTPYEFPELQTPVAPAPAKPLEPSTAQQAHKKPSSAPKENLKLTPQEPGSEMSPAHRVFEHWKRVMDKPRAVFGGPRETKIKARLAEGYTVQDLCQAIDGYSRSSHHMGENDRGVPYNDLTLICRDASKVDQGLAFAKAHAPQEAPYEAPELTLEQIRAENEKLLARRAAQQKRDAERGAA